MADFFKILQQAQQMQGRLQQMQEELQHKVVHGSAGGGLVSVEADGRGQIRKIKIDQSLAGQSDVKQRIEGSGAEGGIQIRGRRHADRLADRQGAEILARPTGGVDDCGRERVRAVPQFLDEFTRRAAAPIDGNPSSGHALSSLPRRGTRAWRGRPR